MFRVIPRVEKDGTPILFLPDDTGPNFGCIGCYAHIGQHSAAAVGYYREFTRPARKGECDALLREYASIPPAGELIILHRMPRLK
jgi:hypothetical protein